MSKLLERLRNHLNKISSEQFQKEWDEIEAMGFGEDIAKIKENTWCSIIELFESAKGGVHEEQLDLYLWLKENYEAPKRKNKRL
jgi:hypothetical protein